MSHPSETDSTSPESADVPNDEKKEEHERLARKRGAMSRSDASSVGKVTSSIRLHPFRTIIILAIIILILLFLIFTYGLGSGGGRVLPGSSKGSDATPVSVTTASPGKAGTDKEEKTDESEKPVVRRELIVSFFPSRSDPDTAEDLSCRLDWVDPLTETHQRKNITMESKADFELALEQAIRAWRKSLESNTMKNVPVVAVLMMPFPGEGVFRKIETLARQLDDRINILRLETQPNP